MVILLYIAIGYLLLTTVILLTNRKDFIPLRPVADKAFDSSSPFVSICIPARNEEQNIERCLRSVLNQSYPNLEILVLDDQSTDHTPYILQYLQNVNEDALKIIHGAPKPDGWLGKQWACQQLADHSAGSILIFMDADTWLESDTVSKVVRTMGHDIVELLTVWPMQELRTFWEKTIIPLVYYSLLSLMPARYVYRFPRWIPSPLRRLLAPLFSAACGQFIAVKSSVYQVIGGHQSVRDHIIDDIALARAIRKAGFRMRMYHGHEAISCKMYATEKELFEGFRKNFFAGFGYNIAFFVVTALMHMLVYLLPFFAFFAGLLYGLSDWTLLSILAILVILFHRLLMARWFNWNPGYAFLHPLGVLWFQKLGIRVLRDYFSGEPIQWKERII